MEEKNKKVYDYSCLMLKLNLQNIVEFAKNNINEDDLYQDETDPSKFGLEPESHVTILYGLHDTVKTKDVFDVCKLFKPVNVLLDDVSIFDNELYDVLKFDLYSDDLYTMNNIFTSMFEYTTDYPDYHAHVTIAYIKKGMAEQYIQMFKKFIKTEIFSGYEFIYSEPNGTKTNLNLLTFNANVLNVNENHKKKIFMNMFEGIDKNILNEVFENDEKILTQLEKFKLDRHNNILANIKESNIIYGSELFYINESYRNTKTYNIRVNGIANKELTIESLNNDKFDFDLLFRDEFGENQIVREFKNCTLHEVIIFMNVNRIVEDITIPKKRRIN